MSAARHHEGASQSDATDESIRALPTAALKALETRAGGYWAVTAQDKSTGAFTMCYFPCDGSHAVSYDMRTCESEQQVRENLANRLYKFTPAMHKTTSSKMKIDETSAAFPFSAPDEFSSNRATYTQETNYHDTTSITFPGAQGFNSYNSAAPFPSVQSTLPEQLSGPAASVAHVSAPQVLPQRERPLHSSSITNQMSSDKFQYMESPSEAQSVITTDTPVEMDWGFAENMGSATTDSFMSQEDASNMSGNFEDATGFYEDAFNPTIPNEPWTQFDMRDHVDNIFANH